MLKMEIIKKDVVIAFHVGTNDELSKWYQDNKASFGDIYSYQTKISDYVEPKPKSKWWPF